MNANQPLSFVKRIWGSDGSAKFRAASWVVAFGAFGLWVMYDQKSSGVLTSGPSTVASKFSDAEIEKWNKDMKTKIDRQEKEQQKRLQAEAAAIADAKR